MAWHNSGFTATNVAPGNYPVEFRSVPGWLAIPPSLTLTNPDNAAVVTANATARITNNYYPTFTPTSVNNAAGSLTVNLGANPPIGAGWRFLGDTNAFFASNFTTNLLPGTYLIEFAGPFNNRATPPNGSVQVLRRCADVGGGDLSLRRATPGLRAFADARSRRRDCRRDGLSVRFQRIVAIGGGFRQRRGGAIQCGAHGGTPGF